MRKAGAGFCNTPQAVPQLASLGNEVVIRIDYQQRRDVPVVCHGVHRFP